MKKWSLAYFAAIVFTTYLALYFFCYLNPDRTVTIKKYGPDLLFEYNHQRNIYSVEIVKRVDGRTISSTPTVDRNGDPMQFRESVRFFVKNLASPLKNNTVYVAMLSNNEENIVVGVFCIKNSTVLNIKRGWFPESDEQFAKRCSS
ncbi:hypothetical protein QU481_04500 [Crenobacter sp. SG2303]|uniref:Uncharacterized protein n=1 Tax=Crenobacter oryzisoli TaxID=3056844 RepID=A0ABT7XK26_9NEIS|nr:hypothetical protein [Crenobacter sp. SG2303]MDN0074148.1 hypothetical protein [Crenobacter sp. SG2303]